MRIWAKLNAFYSLDLLYTTYVAYNTTEAPGNSVSVLECSNYINTQLMLAQTFSKVKVPESNKQD